MVPGSWGATSPASTLVSTSCALTRWLPCRASRATRPLPAGDVRQLDDIASRWIAYRSEALRPAAGGRDRRLPPMLGKRGGPAGERLTAELSRYKLAKITGCDHDGYHRLACPAVQGKLRCELRPPSMELPHTRPQVLCPPEHPPAVPSRRSPCRRARTPRHSRSTTTPPAPTASPTPDVQRQSAPTPPSRTPPPTTSPGDGAS